MNFYGSKRAAFCLTKGTGRSIGLLRAETGSLGMDDASAESRRVP